MYVLKVRTMGQRMLPHIGPPAKVPPDKMVFNKTARIMVFSSVLPGVCGSWEFEIVGFSKI